VPFTATTAHFSAADGDEQQHIFQQQLEMSLTERAKYIFGSKSVTIYGSSWRCQ